MKPDPKTWADKLIPDMRGWALLGFFYLTYETLQMIKANPALLAVPSFMQFASQLAGGGLLLAAAWLYSAVKKDRDAQPVEVVNGPREPVPVDAEVKP